MFGIRSVVFQSLRFRKLCFKIWEYVGEISKLRSRLVGVQIFWLGYFGFAFGIKSVKFQNFGITSERLQYFELDQWSVRMQD